MSLQEAKRTLSRVLASGNNRVVALSGKCGTGKTRLWETVRLESHNGRLANSIYVSLFGIANVEQLGLKLLQKTLSIESGSVYVADDERNLPSTTSGFIHRWSKAISVIPDFARLSVPSALRGQLVVLDDVARKHSSLKLADVLSFIERLSTHHNVRFLIIINSDQLDENSKRLWGVFQQEVLDCEVNLGLTAEEAFEMAIGRGRPTHYHAIRKAVAFFNITNVRLLLRISLVFEQMLGNHPDLPDSVLSKLAPATVLLCAIHFGGIQKGMNFGFFSRFVDLDCNCTVDECEKHNDDDLVFLWKTLLNDAGLGISEEFESIIVDYLVAGSLDKARVSKALDQCIANEKKLHSQVFLHIIRDLVVWHH